MSDETRAAVAEAQEAAQRCEEEARVEEQACLDVIAQGLPAHLEKTAKHSAQAEPEVTKQIGAEGIKRFRADLREASNALALDLKGAADRIKWPVRDTEYGRVTSRDVHKALFDYLWGAKLNSLAQIFKAHGYSIHDDNSRRAQGLIVPQSLYDEEGFTSLADALDRLSRARMAVAKAKAADDESIVDTLWGEE